MFSVVWWHMPSHAVSCCLMLSLSLAPGDGWKSGTDMRTRPAPRGCATIPAAAPWQCMTKGERRHRRSNMSNGPMVLLWMFHVEICLMLRSFTAKHCEAMKSWIIHNNSGDQRTSHCINHHQPIKLWPEAVCLKSSSNISALLWRAEARTRTEDENGVSMSSPQAPKTRVPGCFLRLPSLGDFMWLQSQRSSKK